MRSSLRRSLTLICLVPALTLAMSSCKNNAESTIDGGDPKAVPPKDEVAKKYIEVTPDTFIRAESDRYFLNHTRLAGGVNKYYYVPGLTPLDNQAVVRMNRDTLYGAAVVDTEGGATVTLPKSSDGRYVSIVVLDNDHYMPQVIYEPGTYDLPQRTKYVFVGTRVHVRNPNDPADIAKASEILRQVSISTHSDTPFDPPHWDQKSLDALRAEYEKEFAKYEKFPDAWQGAPGTLDEDTRQYAAAGAWGLFANKDATYLNYNGNHSEKDCFVGQFKVPDNNAFWSITLYGDDGYMKSDNAILNDANTTINKDGTFTAYFGPESACGNVKNRVDTSPGWNYTMRVYRPGASVLSGQYKLPKLTKVDLKAGSD